jgi:hypothetical protein
VQDQSVHEQDGADEEEDDGRQGSDGAQARIGMARARVMPMPIGLDAHLT